MTASPDTLKEAFEKAQQDVLALPERPPPAALLELYALYKQATVGDVSGKRPGLIDVKGRAKHDAWGGKHGMTQDAAMAAYVSQVDLLLGR